MERIPSCIYGTAKKKRSPDQRLIKQKYRLCAHVSTQQWGVNYCDTYSPVVNWISFWAMLTLSIIIELRTKSVDCFLSYTQADLKLDIFM